MVMIALFIFILTFVSIGALTYQYAPSFIQRYTYIQDKRIEKTATQLRGMFIFTEKRRLLLVFTLLPLALSIIGLIILRGPLGAVLGLALGFALPSIVIKSLAKKRLGDFDKQLVDGLMFISSSLKAGMSLTQAIEVVSEELPPPIGEEFSLVLKENRMGVALDDCLAHLKKRIPNEDLNLITTAISISRETGGDLTEVLAKLAFTIREKKKLEDRVKALTVQGRMQGLIMSLLPIGFSCFIYFVNPENFNIMLEDQLGRLLLMWAVVSEIIGVILIRKFCKVEV